MTKIKGPQKQQINALQKAGLGYKRIAKTLEMPSNTIKAHIRRKKFLAELPPKVVLPRCKLSGRQSLQIKKYLNDYPTAKLDHVIAALTLDCHKSTLSRYLKKIGYENRAAKPGILLRDQNKQKRLEFCREMLQKDDAYYKRIFWTDEFTIQTWPNGEVLFYWTPKDSTVHDDLRSAKVQNGGHRIMFWASMTYYSYGPLTDLEGSQNQQTYKELLTDLVAPEFAASEVDLVFQHDNAPCHTANSVKNYLRRKRWETLDWPPQSPDLSPIEWFWNILKMKIKAMDPRPGIDKRYL